MICAVILVVLGILVYYCVPFCYLFHKFKVFFLILEAIFLLLAIGIITITNCF